MYSTSIIHEKGIIYCYRNTYTVKASYHFLMLVSESFSLTTCMLTNDMP